MQLGGQGGGRDVEDGRQGQRRLHRMGDLVVVGDDVVGGHRKRERCPGAVVDGAAQRRQRHGDGGLAPGRSLEGAGVEDLHIDQARHEEQHRDHEDQPDQPHPALEGAALPAPARARDREPRHLGRRAVRALAGTRRGGRRGGGRAGRPGGPRRTGRAGGRGRPGGAGPWGSFLGVARAPRNSARATRLVSGRDAHGVDVGVVVEPEAVPVPAGAPAPAAEEVVGGGAAGAGVTVGVGRGTESET